MVALQEGYRAYELTSTYGGVEQRWVLIYSEPRRAQVQRTVDRQWRKQSDQDVKALKTLGGVTFACEADARQALATFTQGLQATFLGASTVRATPRYGKRGRPGPGVQPTQMVYQIEGGLVSSLAARQALIDQHSCFHPGHQRTRRHPTATATAVGRLQRPNACGARVSLLERPRVFGRLALPQKT